MILRKKLYFSLIQTIDSQHKFEQTGCIIVLPAASQYVVSLITLEAFANTKFGQNVYWHNILDKFDN